MHPARPAGAHLDWDDRRDGVRRLTSDILFDSQHLSRDLPAKSVRGGPGDRHGCGNGLGQLGEGLDRAIRHFICDG